MICSIFLKLRYYINPFLLICFFIVEGTFCCNVSTVKSRTIEQIKEKQYLQPPSGSGFDHFGASVAISNDTMAVGVPNYDSKWSDSGSVFIYRLVQGKWRVHKRIQANPAREQGLFGSSVALEGSYLIVGEPGSQYDQRGYVHVFAKNHGGTNGWGWLRRLLRPDDCHLRENDGFGDSVSISGQYFLIGAPTACKNRQDWIETTGAAYLYSNYGSNFQKKLLAHNGREDDSFGTAVALCGSYAFVGASDADAGVLRESAGAAYIYAKEKGWTLQHYISPSYTLEGDRFGTSLSCTSMYAAVGAPAESSSYGSDKRKGSVYVYKKNDSGVSAWNLMKRLDEEEYFNEEADRNNHFGQSLSLDGNYLVVGFGESAKGDLDEEPMAQIFRLDKNVWKPVKAYTKPVDRSCTTSSYDRGFSVAFNSKTFAITDMEDESDAVRCGRGLAAGIALKELIYREVTGMPFLYLLTGSDEL